MKFLAIDVGTGTQDIMLYDTTEPMENSIKLVLPSPTRIMAGKIRKTNTDIFMDGETMGGGPINRALSQHIDKGYQVTMTKRAALTVRDDLERVRSMGIKIVDSKKDLETTHFKNITLSDVNLEALKSSLAPFDVKLDFDYVGVAVQDHGYSAHMGDRNFRFLKIKEKLQKPLFPEEFAYTTHIPPYFSRMQAVQRTLKDKHPLVMDSKFAAVCGATCDPEVQKMDSYVVMDVGNGHTLAASIEKGKIRGIMEHHTGVLTPEKIEDYVEKLIKGTLTNEEIYNDHGHGAWVLKPINKLQKVILTGPRRSIVEKTNLPFYNASPAGDVMMAGPVGLIKSIKYKNR